MQVHNLSPSDWGKAAGVGLAVAILTAAFMFTGFKTGISPLPESLGLAFSETLLGRELPLPVGLLFHTAWVTLFSVIYVVLFRDSLTFMRAFWLAFALWILVLVFFFPFVGWGFLGLNISPKLIVGSAVPHLLFAVLLWGLCKMIFNAPREQPAHDVQHRYQHR
ncbi:hypothetical protein [Bradyrhizobium icense]|uniref:DUF1440 domain-containing protein n=1 Tax=Bradyrhizobium icense TaxID=1274631 RepID=A0A1B1UNC4_9BRAD|nr:hypothetical protein [Bradyrhizobium icense]ANW04214.1 hypothetical protein LMTR13_32790 [Bradyrhizobium icense]